jgi:hypothetical protein
MPVGVSEAACICIICAPLFLLHFKSSIKSLKKSAKPLLFLLVLGNTKLPLKIDTIMKKPANNARRGACTIKLPFGPFGPCLNTFIMPEGLRLV